MLIHLSHTPAMEVDCIIFPHFTDVKTETEGSGSYKKEVQKPGFRTWQSGSHSHSHNDYDIYKN